MFGQGRRDLSVKMVLGPQARAQALLVGEDEAKPEAEEVVVQPVAEVALGRQRRELVDQAHPAQLGEVGAERRVRHAQSARQVVHSPFPQGQLLQQREVSPRAAELLLQHLARIVEERAAAVEDGAADRRAQRGVAPPLDRLSSLEEGLGLLEGERGDRQRGETSAKRAPLPEQAAHLRDVRAAEHQLQSRAVALLLDRRLHLGEDLPPAPLGTGRTFAKPI